MMLHAFQEQLIVAQGTIPNRKYGKGEEKSTAGGLNYGLITSKMSAMVDLQHHGEGFCEPFYVLVAEKTQRDGAMMHMWRLELCSDGDQPNNDQDGDNRYQLPNTHKFFETILFFDIDSRQSSLTSYRGPE